MSDEAHPFGLTWEQALFARARFVEWLRIKEREERKPGNLIVKVEDGSYRKVGPPRWQRSSLTFLCADIDHSALLLRLLQGKPALPAPPPLRHAYPVYPDEEDA